MKKLWLSCCGLVMWMSVAAYAADGATVGVRDLFTKKFDAKMASCFEDENAPYDCKVWINAAFQGVAKTFDIMIDGQKSMKMYGLQLWNDDVVDVYAGVRIGRVIGDHIEIGMVGSKKASWVLITPAPSGDSLLFQDFLYRSDGTYSRSELRLSPVL